MAEDAAKSLPPRTLISPIQENTEDAPVILSQNLNNFSEEAKENIEKTTVSVQTDFEDEPGDNFSVKSFKDNKSVAVLETNDQGTNTELDMSFELVQDDLEENIENEITVIEQTPKITKDKSSKDITVVEKIELVTDDKPTCHDASEVENMGNRDDNAFSKPNAGSEAINSKASFNPPDVCEESQKPKSNPESPKLKLKVNRERKNDNPKPPLNKESPKISQLTKTEPPKPDLGKESPKLKPKINKEVKDETTKPTSIKESPKFNSKAAKETKIDSPKTTKGKDTPKVNESIKIDKLSNYVEPSSAPIEEAKTLQNVKSKNLLII